MICKVEHRLKRYCCEDISLIENYEKAINSEEQYDIHHRLEIELNKSRSELIKLNLYYNRPASELIFLTKSEHHKLHSKYKDNSKFVYSRLGKNHSEAIKQKISNTKLGHIVTDETKDKISKAHQGKHYSKLREAHLGKKHSETTKQKMSESHKGDKNPNYGKHFSEETRQKMRESHLKRRNLHSNTLF